MEKLAKDQLIPFSIGGGWVIAQLGGWDLLLQTLVTFMLLDFISGIIKALWEKGLSSQLCFIGITKKLLIFILITVAVSLERILGNQIPLRELVVFFYLTQEGLSILENSSTFIPLPEKLKAVFQQLQHDKSS